MKKYLLFFLLFPLSVFSQEWVSYGQSTKGDVFYYDKESLKVLGEKRFVLGMQDYVSPSEGGTQNTKKYMTIDCDEYSIETSMFRTYNLPMGNGETITNFNPNDKFKVSKVGNTMNHTLLSTLCK